MQPVISVRNLSKRYQLGLTHAGSVRELVNRAAASLLGRKTSAGASTEGPDRATADHVWALQDVSFDVYPGEVLGIIGRNGAGKSTLLKILSRITCPTAGRIEMRGRVASLLEVGTGFHPELTGRENVYMNGTVLGMTRREIDRAFDSIVDFAGVEAFIDTPVKRYSSGMTVRLGFAVAAHMSPEILIIDEVLAVGDAEFQKRCIGKMDDVAKSGRTVLFVSHNMASIRQLAPRSVLIQGGKVIFDGTTDMALERYLGHSAQISKDANSISSIKRMAWAGDRSLEFVNARVESSPSDLANGRLCISVKIAAHIASENVRVGLTLLHSDGTAVGSCFSQPVRELEAEAVRNIRIELDLRDLSPGHYWFRMGLLNPRNQLTDLVDEVLHFEVPHGRNVPDEFVQWNAGWGPIRFRVESQTTQSSTCFGESALQTKSDLGE